MVKLPAGEARAGETWVTVSARLAADEAWAEEGYEVAWGQMRLPFLGGQRPEVHGLDVAGASAAASAGVLPSEGALSSGGAVVSGDVVPVGGVVSAGVGSVGDVGVLEGLGRRGPYRIVVGPGEFDGRTGRLRGLFGLDVDGPRLELWRAPTDNDRASGLSWKWQVLGLHRLTHRVDAVEADGSELVVRTRVAPAATDLGMLATYRWRAEGDTLAMTLDITPEGEWKDPIPRLGITLSLPGAVEEVVWFGNGPGEAYADTGMAARVGRWRATIEELQTPYVYPQENGHRADVRWAELLDGEGRGVRVTGDPVFGLTARRWTTAELTAARHRPDLRPGDRVHVDFDLAHHGIGTASCGPGPLPRYELHAHAATLRLRFDRAS